jgi:hypothetical protein
VKGVLSVDEHPGRLQGVVDDVFQGSLESGQNPD